MVTAAHSAGVKALISVGGGGGGGGFAGIVEGGDYVLSGMFNVVDIVMIMAYDDNNFQHSTYELGTQCMAYWLGRACPAREAILGVPFYGHDMWWLQMSRSGRSSPLREIMGSMSAVTMRTARWPVTGLCLRPGSNLRW